MSFTSGIFIDYQVLILSLERYDNPDSMILIMLVLTFDWVQGQGYKDYYQRLYI